MEPQVLDADASPQLRMKRVRRPVRRPDASGFVLYLTPWERTLLQQLADHLGSDCNKVLRGLILREARKLEAGKLE